ncbi:protein-L-isoaspartate O-methyltransferase family protein [Actinoplanes philippinensis]|uniref:protein-L-isoaspartate O-methyltransferase family protein n=1 Tax=Actinoplanes philippinensis TaxID=35752 RepID=UPI0033F9EC8B
MEDVRRRYLEQIRGDGLPPALAEAFATVPREVFVADGFHSRDGRRVMPADPEYLPTVYSNDVLVTKLAGDVPVSSSSQPSLMAAMIEALDVTPGMRILEIGAGTGYNAALLASLGAVVTTVDVQADVAARARSALARAGIAGVRVEVADGYTGGPPERYDRIIVTVGVSGISPHWLDRLEPGGRLIVPVAHGGIHPVLDIRTEPLTVTDVSTGPLSATDVGTGPLSATDVRTGPLSATVVCAAGFMGAAGPLGARHGRSHPPVAAGLRGLEEVAPARWRPPLDADAYRGLWFAAAAWHSRVSHASIPGREQSYLAVLDDSEAAGAVVLADGAILASGPEAERCTAVGTALADRWWSLNRPSIHSWRIGFALVGDPATPIWAPHRWTLTTAPPNPPDTATPHNPETPE